MGVPGFFAWLLKNKNKLGASNLILSQLDIQIDWLMLDTNCLLHPCISHVIEKYKNNLLNIDKTIDIRTQLEKIIWDNIELYIDNMIDEIKPKYIYIGIDGVAPMGKILQQRQRRYRYLFDKKIKLDSVKNNTANTDNLEIPITSIELTPGTNYMERINKCMEKYVKKLGKRGIKYVYSSYHDEGEGEHKILQYIKNNLTPDDSIVIYGLDADLLFLSLGLNSNSNLYVMREKQVFTNNPVNMDIIINKSQEFLESNYNFVKVCELELLITNLNISIDDFIVLCYLIGNDFLPGLVTIDIKKGGLDKIFKAWENLKINIGIGTEYESNGKIKSHLVYKDNLKYKINLEILKELFEELVWTEKYIWKNMNRDNIMNQDNLELEQMEKMKYSKQYDKNELMKKFLNGTSSNIDFLDKIEFNCSNEYYSYYLGINSIHIDNNIIQKMVQDYINCIEWCINYYLDDCISWSQSYNFPIAPLIEDIIYFFPTKTRIKKDSRILNPVEQLILAIPLDTWEYVIEKNIIELINENKNIGYMFPKEFPIDINKENLFWKCQVRIPIVEYKEYIKEIKKINIKNEKNLIYKYIKNF